MVYLDSCQISITELFCNNSLRLKAENYFYKKAPSKYASGFQFSIQFARLFLRQTKLPKWNIRLYHKGFMDTH